MHECSKDFPLHSQLETGDTREVLTQCCGGAGGTGNTMWQTGTDRIEALLPNSQQVVGVHGLHICCDLLNPGLPCTAWLWLCS